jgi:hypothetical protein
MCLEIAEQVGHHWYEGDLRNEWSVKSPLYSFYASYDAPTAIFHVSLAERTDGLQDGG